MDFRNLFPSKQVDASGVRPNPKRLNILSDRAEVISVCPAVPYFNWKRNTHRLVISFHPRRVQRQPSSIIMGKGRTEILNHGIEHPNARSGLHSLSHCPTAQGVKSFLKRLAPFHRTGMGGR